MKTNWLLSGWRCRCPEPLWLKDARPGTQLVFLLVFCWSAASHLAIGGTRSSLLTEADVPGRGLAESDLEDMQPFELLWDVLLPLSGLSVGAFGLRLTLGLSISEPLLLLAAPQTDGVLRGFHDRLLSWHVGGLFGHPMIIAQLAAARCEGGETHRPGPEAAAIGCLVGAYAAGALAGGVLRRSVKVLELPPTALTLTVLVLVLINVYLIHSKYGAFLTEHHAHAPHTGEELSPSQLAADAAEAAASSSMSALAQPLRLLSQNLEGWNEQTSAGEATPLLADRPATKTGGPSFIAACNWISWLLWKMFVVICAVLKELWRVLRIAYTSSDLIIGRSLILFAFAIVSGPAPLPRWDPFAGTPLRHGFGVYWFDLVGIATSAFLVPTFISSCVKPKLCLDVCFMFALTACLAAVIASLRAELSSFMSAMLAGGMLGVCASFANAVFSMRMIRRARKDAAVALGWGLLASGLAQVLGVHAGTFLFSHSAVNSWFAVTACAGLSCAASWGFSRLHQDSENDEIVS